MSKKIKEERDENAWVEEAVFKSFNDKGLGEVVKIKQEPMWWKNELEVEEAIEVRPQMERRQSRSLRNSVINGDADEDGNEIRIDLIGCCEPTCKLDVNQIGEVKTVDCYGVAASHRANVRADRCDRWHQIGNSCNVAGRVEIPLTSVGRRYTVDENGVAIRESRLGEELIRCEGNVCIGPREAQRDVFCLTRWQTPRVKVV